MSKHIKSIKGLFGQIIHYEDSIKVGESWPGLFNGSLNHYDADGRYVGYSDRGMIADLVHHDEHGDYLGETRTGLFGQKKHYSADQGYVGETSDDFIGNTTDLVEVSDLSSSQGYAAHHDWNEDCAG